MEIKYDIHKLKNIIHGLATLTGISICLCDTDGKWLINCAGKDDFCSAIQSMDNNLCRCNCSDNNIFQKCKKSLQLEQHICYAGLCDLAMPIIKKDIIVAYVIMGRIRTFQSPDYADNSYLISKNSVLLRELYQETPFFTSEKIECMKVLLPQILFADAIQIEFNDFINEVTEYIENHLQERLTVASVCATFHVSKNRLYEAFHNTFNCTVNEYISSRRLKKAMVLLTETDTPVYRIAEIIGFDNYTYFCKLFKHREGISPTAYRKKTQEKGVSSPSS